MKLATYKDGSRDGQLVVVSRDLSTAHYATGIAHKLQQALDDWNFHAPQLHDLYVTLNQGKARHAFPFDPALCMAPLPRAYQWADGSAYINHVELVRAARSSEVPHSFYTDPLMYQGGSDDFIGPCDDVVVPSEDFGIDFEAEIAVVTGDVPMGCTPEQALDGVRLLMLVNDVSLRNLIPNELAKGFGFFQSKPATAFSPVAVTPDELGDAWQIVLFRHGGQRVLRLLADRQQLAFERVLAGAVFAARNDRLLDDRHRIDHRLAQPVERKRHFAPTDEALAFLRSEFLELFSDKSACRIVLRHEAHGDAIIAGSG